MMKGKNTLQLGENGGDLERDNTSVEAGHSKGVQSMEVLLVELAD